MLRSSIFCVAVARSEGSPAPTVLLVYASTVSVPLPTCPGETLPAIDLDSSVPTPLLVGSNILFFPDLISVLQAAKKDDGKPEFSRLSAVTGAKGASLKIAAELFLPKENREQSFIPGENGRGLPSRLREAVSTYRGVPAYTELVSEAKKKPRSEDKMSRLKSRLAELLEKR